LYNSSTLKDLDKIYLDFVNKCGSVKSKYLENDVRLSYYYLSYQNIDAALHLLIFNREKLKEEQLRQIYRANNIKNRFDGLQFPPELRIRQMSTNFEQFVANQYSLSIFCLFEHCFRIMIRQIYPAEYRRMEKGFMDMFKFFVNKFRSNSVYFSQLNSSFFDFFNAVRNSIHTNGIFLPHGKNIGYKKIYHDLSGNQITFEYGKIIPYNGVWNSHIQMTEKFFLIYNELIEIQEIKSEPFIKDPSVLL
jgi:hypothetical protein